MRVPVGVMSYRQVSRMQDSDMNARRDSEVTPSRTFSMVMECASVRQLSDK